MSEITAHCSQELFSVDEVFGLFVDSFVADEVSQLVFTSVWGRDTAVQELLARLTIPVAEGGLDSLTLRDGNNTTRQTLWIKDRSGLEKLNGRMPKDNLFGEIVHLWLFDHLIREPDRANRRGYLLLQSICEQKVWSLVKETCHLPMLDHWCSVILDHFRRLGWVNTLTNVYGISCVRLDLGSDDVEATVGDLIRSGQLSLN